MTDPSPVPVPECVDSGVPVVLPAPVPSLTRPDLRWDRGGGCGMGRSPTPYLPIMGKRCNTGVQVSQVHEDVPEVRTQIKPVQSADHEARHETLSSTPIPPTLPGLRGPSRTRVIW